MTQNEEILFEKAIDFIVETQSSNDYICERMIDYNGNYCANNCQNLNSECVKLFLLNIYEKTMEE